MDLNSIQRLYPQYQRSQDRRQRDIPVAIDRRSGQDRREQDRVVMDKQLTKDIFEVKKYFLWDLIPKTTILNKEKIIMKYTHFADDKEKMADFKILTKEEFLFSYSYLTEEEYDMTDI